MYSEINMLKSGSRKKIITILTEYFRNKETELQHNSISDNKIEKSRIKNKDNGYHGLSEAHLREVCRLSSTDPESRIADISSKGMKTILEHICSDRYTISGTAGFKAAMCTAGGVELSQINLKTMESEDFPHMYIIGECLDVDGDTGGYNIHFAMASAMAAAKAITDSIKAADKNNCKQRN